MNPITAAELAKHIGGKVRGRTDRLITGMEAIDQAGPDQATFVSRASFARLWPDAKAGAVIASSTLALDPGEGRAVIDVDDANLGVALALEVFAPPQPRPAPGIHPLAVVDDSATLGEHVAIGPYCMIGPGVTLGDGCVLHANVHIFDHTTVGRGCVFWSGVVIRERCTIGDGCIFHPNVVVGADGFGYVPSPDGRGLVKVPQIGTVTIGHQVELGAGTCVDRGKFGATVIGDGTKIDNQCQIAHNVRLGRAVVMAAQCGLAGSTQVGDGVMFGGQTGVIEHIKIGAGARIASKTGITRDVAPGEEVMGFPAQPARSFLRSHALLRKLPDLVKRLERQ